jgi:hypothetical protein
MEMDFTPGERAVLAQIRVLYKIAGERSQQLKALQMQWTPSHYEAYQRAFGSLLARQFVEDSGAHSFKITDSGLRAIGVSAPRLAVHAVVGVEERPISQGPAPKAQGAREQKNAARQPSARGGFSRLVLSLLGQRT